MVVPSGNLAVALYKHFSIIPLNLGRNKIKEDWLPRDPNFFSEWGPPTPAGVYASHAFTVNGDISARTDITIDNNSTPMDLGNLSNKVLENVLLGNPNNPNHHWEIFIPDPKDYPKPGMARARLQRIFDRYIKNIVYSAVDLSHTRDEGRDPSKQNAGWFARYEIDRNTSTSGTRHVTVLTKRHYSAATGFIEEELQDAFN